MTSGAHNGIFYEDIGSGLPVVLGHSFLCTGDMWREQTRALQGSYRFINIDFRGHGRSDPVHQPFSLYDAVDDVTGVLDALGIDRAVWCGLSIGGMVALRAALTAPDRVSALALMDTDAGPERLRRKIKYRVMGAGVSILSVRPFLPPITKLMFGESTRSGNPQLVKEWQQIFEGMDVPSALRCLDALIKRDSLLSKLSDIAVPSIVMVGEEDASLPIEVSQRIHAGLSDSEFVTIPNAGHLSALEQPAPVNEALDVFLRRVAYSASPA